MPGLPMLSQIPNLAVANKRDEIIYQARCTDEPNKDLRDLDEDLDETNDCRF